MAREVLARLRSLWSGSIRRQLVIGIAGVHAVLMTAFVYDLVQRQSEFLMDQMVKHATSLASSLAAASRSWILASDVAGLEEVLASQSTFPSLRYALILAKDGKVLGYTDHGEEGKYVSDPVSLSLLDKPPSTVILINSSSVVDVAVPILANSKHVGWARAGIGKGEMAQSLRILGWRGIFYTLVAIAIGTGFALVMGRRLTRDLTRLVAVARRATANTCGFDRGDELGDVSRAILQSRVMFENAQEAIAITDGANNFISINPAFTCITGYEADEVLGRNPRILTSGYHPPEFYRAMWESLLATGRWKGEIWNKRKNGEIFLVALSISVIRDASGSPLYFIGIFLDITQRRNDEELILRQATTDALTGLPNRTLLMDRIGQAIVYADRNSKTFALMFIDLDRFKQVNDQYGHEVGDQLLVAVSHRLKERVRNSDTVSRFGGDEFIILTGEFDYLNGPETIARKVQEALTGEISIAGKNLFLSCSIGIALYPFDGETPGKLIQSADMAMYRAKELGRNKFSFFTAEMNRKIEVRAKLENDLRRAVASDAFVNFYQPIISMRTGEVVKVEALVRWNHPERGLVMPDEFIGAAEETGLILEIGERVLCNACMDLAAFRKISPSIRAVAVNCSARQMQEMNFCGTVTRVLTGMETAPEMIELEITESIFIDFDNFYATEALQELRGLGVKLSLDDFGTGYSSLSYLKKFPVDVLKVDKSFVRDITKDEEDLKLVGTIIDIAHNFGLTVVAEGIEEKRQENLLRDLRCDCVQGYYYSRPVSRAAMLEFLEKAERRKIAPVVT